jgi:hypothetical protein
MDVHVPQSGDDELPGRPQTIREAAGMRVDADGPIAVIRSPVMTMLRCAAATP